MNSEVKIQSSKEQWENISQGGELEFHKRPNIRSDSQKFLEGNSRLWTMLGFKSDQYTGKTILDVGAGSKLRGKFFSNATLWAIEPLGDKFVKEVAWCDLKEADRLYSCPAEEMIVDIAYQCDFVFSINVLDYCFDFKQIVENIYHYVKPEGLVFLAYDSHNKVDPLHPLVLDQKISDQIYKDLGFHIKKSQKISTFHKGISDYALAYWLSKK
jgi:2-polyprenyl-3-methyl-5-hydroxy-6-metoxy-1,4-benzoquinol methylase